MADMQSALALESPSSDAHDRIMAARTSSFAFALVFSDRFSASRQSCLALPSSSWDLTILPIRACKHSSLAMPSCSRAPTSAPMQSDLACWSASSETAMAPIRACRHSSLALPSCSRAPSSAPMQSALAVLSMSWEDPMAVIKACRHSSLALPSCSRDPRSAPMHSSLACSSMPPDDPTAAIRALKHSCFDWPSSSSAPSIADKHSDLALSSASCPPTWPTNACMHSCLALPSSSMALMSAPMQSVLACWSRSSDAVIAPTSACRHSFLALSSSSSAPTSAPIHSCLDFLSPSIDTRSAVMQSSLAVWSYSCRDVIKADRHSFLASPSALIARSSSPCSSLSIFFAADSSSFFLDVLFACAAPFGDGRAAAGFGPAGACGSPLLHNLAASIAAGSAGLSRSTACMASESFTSRPCLDRYSRAAFMSCVSLLSFFWPDSCWLDSSGSTLTFRPRQPKPASPQSISTSLAPELVALTSRLQLPMRWNTSTLPRRRSPACGKRKECRAESRDSFWASPMRTEMKQSLGMPSPLLRSTRSWTIFPCDEARTADG
mmetsp:Transcript_91184/g.254664  ORF Transcript_91184/g.254664 Transcript_91184/m.254664 type:complete len:550 (+) Transcript_91184:339-1988(+)